MSTTVYLDTDETRSHPLHAHSLGERWNGYEVPRVTAAEFARFVAEWRAADPNGTWGEVTVGAHYLRLTRNDSDDSGDADEWPWVAEDEQGRALYALDGWGWVKA